MPLLSKKKVGFRKRKAYGGASWKRYGARAGGLAYRAYQGVKKIQRLINVEKKYFDTSAGTQPSSTGTVISLSNIAQGDDYNNRDGHSILAQSIYFKARVGMNSTSPYSWVRLILFADNDQRGTDPAVTDLLETSDVNSPLQHDVNRRFNIIMDKEVSLSNTGTQAVFIKKFIKYNQHLKYTGTAGTDASAQEGNLFLLLISSESTLVPIVQWYNRLRFTDN